MKMVYWMILFLLSFTCFTFYFSPIFVALHFKSYLPLALESQNIHIILKKASFCLLLASIFLNYLHIAYILQTFTFSFISIWHFPLARFVSCHSSALHLKHLSLLGFVTSDRFSRFPRSCWVLILSFKASQTFHTLSTQDSLAFWNLMNKLLISWLLRLPFSSVCFRRYFPNLWMRASYSTKSKPWKADIIPSSPPHSTVRLQVFSLDRFLTILHHCGIG